MDRAGAGERDIARVVSAYRIAVLMCGFDETVDTFGFWFANRKKTFADGVFSRFTFLSPCACAGERSSATSFVPRCTSSSWAGAVTLRRITVLKCGFVPQ